MSTGQAFVSAMSALLRLMGTSPSGFWMIQTTTEKDHGDKMRNRVGQNKKGLGNHRLDAVAPMPNRISTGSHMSISTWQPL